MKIRLTVSLIFIIQFVFGQIPYGLNYQTVVRESNNKILPNKEVSFRISILKNNITGSIVFQEKHTVKTSDNGIATFIIGQGTNQQNKLSNIIWGEDNFFLQIELDVNAGENYLLMGTQQLLSVPYSFEAGNVNLKYAHDESTLTSKSFTRGEWIYDPNDPIEVIVPKSGMYLINATARIFVDGRGLFNSAKCYSAARVFNSTQNKSIAESLNGFSSNSTFFDTEDDVLDNTAPLSTIQFLNENDVIRLEFKIEGKGNGPIIFGHPTENEGASYLNILRISDN